MKFFAKMVIVMLLAVVVSMTLPVDMAQAQDRVAGTVKKSKGRVTAAGTDGQIRRLSRGGRIRSREMIVTAASSYAKLLFNDGGSLYLRPNTRFSVDDYDDRGAQQDKGLFSLLKGGLRYVTGAIGRRNRRAVQVRTPVATIGIRGTDFKARVCDDCGIGRDGLYTETNEGTIVVINGGVEVEAGVGQFIFVCPDPDCPPELLSEAPAVFSSKPILAGMTRKSRSAKGERTSQTV